MTTTATLARDLADVLAADRAAISADVDAAAQQLGVATDALMPLARRITARMAARCRSIRWGDAEVRSAEVWGRMDAIWGEVLSGIRQAPTSPALDALLAIIARQQREIERLTDALAIVTADDPERRAMVAALLDAHAQFGAAQEVRTP